jgi:hypothetical protein
MSYETAKYSVILEVIALKGGDFIEWHYNRPGLRETRFFFTRAITWNDASIIISHPFTRVMVTLCFPSEDIYALPFAISIGEQETPCFRSTNDCRRYYGVTPT